MLIAFLLTLLSLSVGCPQGKTRTYYREQGYKPREYNRERKYEPYGANSKEPCSTPQVVDQFNKYFVDEVKNDKLLTCVFNGARNVTREEFKAALFYISSVVAVQTGFDRPTEKALRTVQSIVPSCKKLTPDLLLSIIPTAVGKRLNEGKKLFPQNAQVLAQSYARYTLEVAESVAGKDCPRSQIQSVITGFPTFLSTQELYSPDNLLEAARVFSNEWRCKDRNVTANKKCPIACFSPEKPGLKLCDQVCKITNKAIDKFVNAFSKQVKNCDILTNLFNVPPTVTPAMLSRGTYYLALHFNGQSKVEQPRDLADFMSRFIKQVKDLNPRVLEQVHSQFLGKHLLSEEILNCENAEKLAEMYADIAKARAELIIDRREERSKVVAIQVSWRRFLQSLNAISRDKLSKIAYLYGNQWRCYA